MDYAKHPVQQALLTLFFILFALGARSATAKSERIYRCPQLNAPPLFSGIPCPSAHPLEAAIINGYAPPTLTKAEQQQLQQLAQKSEHHQARRKRSGKASNATASSACTRHQEALQALQNRRRKGYKLSEAARLDHQQQRLRQDIRLHC